MSRCILLRFNSDRTVAKRKFKRALAAITVLAASALYALAPVSYAACAAMALGPSPPHCQTQAGGEHGASTQVSVKCLALLHGLDASSASRSDALTSPQFHFVALAASPVASASAIVPPPNVKKARPPPTHVPLIIRYAVFLK